MSNVNLTTLLAFNEYLYKDYKRGMRYPQMSKLENTINFFFGFYYFLRRKNVFIFFLNPLTNNGTNARSRKKQRLKSTYRILSTNFIETSLNIIVLVVCVYVLYAFVVCVVCKAKTYKTKNVRLKTI